MGFSIGKISLGSPAHKRYNHNLSFDNNTTFDFGSVQPLMCQYMMPNSDIKASYKQLVRLSPLVAPSFARVHLQNEVSFVPMPEIVPYFEAMQSRMSYSVGLKTYKPEKLPTTTNAWLVFQLLVRNGCQYSYWQPSSDDTLTSSKYTSFKVTTSGTFSDLDKLQAKLVSALSGGLISSSSPYANFLPKLEAGNCLYTSNISDVNQDYVSFESADYVIHFTDKFAITFRLNNAARRMRKIFIGLGYSLNMSDNTPVSFAPILAFYKAWFDLYAVRRTRPWNTTKCFAIIKFIEDNYFTDFDWHFVNGIQTLFSDFWIELRNCWYIFKDDFVSVHRTSPQLAQRSLAYINGLGNTDSVGNTDSSFVGDAYIKQGATTPNIMPSLTNVGLQTLQRLSRFVNKDSVIAQRMSDWLRVHFGSDVVNSVFKEVNHVSSSRLDLQINDVMSTSDTAQGEGDNKTGEVLGAYAGKGVGYHDNGFKFHASTTGYIIVLSAIVPESGYFQGTDTSLYGINNDTLPNADFDALGMELTPKGAIAGDNDILGVVNDTGNYDKLTDVSFGYVPRYSGFKVKKNVVNGDMSRRGSINSLSPYYLDRILTANVITKEEKDTSGKLHVDFSFVALPVASESWRFCSAYPWLGNYNRLFYRSGTLYKGGSVEKDVTSFGEIVDDNFICQSVFDVRVTNCLKPISDSYDTYEESTDKGTVDVMPE